jgi:hypothetical protein
MPILIGIGLVALLSVLSLTPRQRAEARERGRRWNWLWISLTILGWLLILHPWFPHL